MDTQERKIEEMIAASGGEQVTQRKHRVYKYADGCVFVRGSTPSDIRASLSTITNLKRFLAAPKMAGARNVAMAHVLPFESPQRKRISQTPDPMSQNGEVIIPAIGVEW